MEAWITYFKERFSPLFSFAVIFGIALTGVIINRSPFVTAPFVISCITLCFGAILLRLRNDLEDYSKDCIAFPNRTLPRGLISTKEIAVVIQNLKYGMIIYSAFLFLFFGWTTKFILLLTAIYLWYFWNNFYSKEWLPRHPLAKGIARQGLVLPLTFLVISFGRADYVFSSQGWAYAILLFGAFFTFDICRKLDPFSHPASLAYIHYYGFRRVFFITGGALILSALGAYGMGLYLWLWPCELAVWLIMSLLFKKPKNYPLAEMAASVSLVVHAWAGFLQWI